MAWKKSLVDDIDGEPADETVAFGLDGVSYEIDLSAENAARLRDALSSWVGPARKVGRAGRARGRRSTTMSNAQEIREWAKANGYEVSARGRISAELKAAFDAAH